jgi:hypothetical protein
VVELQPRAEGAPVSLISYIAERSLRGALNPCARKLSIFYYWFSLRKCDHTVSYHLYIVTRYL